MPQASSGGSSSKSSSAKKSSSRSSTKRSSSSAGTRAKKSSSASSRSRSTAKKSSAAKSTAKKSTASKASAASNDARLDAVATRVRKLNERIIEAGREAGETTLTSYEKALKAIASGIEKGPGSSDIDWISNLASAQAKFIRDVTASWTAAARSMLK
jgi:DNA-binding protein HU-beta